MELSSFSLVNDMTKPVHLIRFYGMPGVETALAKNTPKYQEILYDLKQWYIILNFAMKEADQSEMGTTIPLEEEVQPAVEEKIEDIEETVLAVKEIKEDEPQPLEEDTLSEFEKLLEENNIG
ncbi:hypothetical protein [Bacillus sp. FJAT-50079]|uniref:hypothetical protein n=1 Tax=Bacillus sp. FJAT-50079 TaxID=2833577 RepID=UPI001BC98444|nr:hypothetical protein [Bacillus sp. FJAT-50079]MBS4209462.1 hypothetical protein [Bacillus sp. FJAT-50079]